MKKKILLSLLALATLLAACQNNEPTLIEGTVTGTDIYGELVPSFTPQEFEAAGIEYGDMLTICIGDSIEVVAPYVAAYTQSGSMAPCMCNYNKADKEVTAAMSNGSFQYHVGGQPGDRFVVKMKKKGGYLNEYNLIQGTYTYERADYASDEVFANFRELKATGLKPGVLYRGTSPINYKSNKVRYQYTASLCKSNGIKTIVDIADSEQKLQEYLAASENKGSYMHECQSNGNIIPIGSNADYLDTLYMKKLGWGLRQMLSRPAPYLIHCNEGKDRTGFYCLLLEALCGASIDQIKEDYMTTFENLYCQQKGTEQYEVTWRINGYRMLYHLTHPQAWADVVAVDWENADIEGLDIARAAQDYILKAGLSLEEIAALKKIIAQ